MARFRETLWFKKGNEVAPQEEPEAGDSDRPIEDRYFDDGSISVVDHAQFSVVTGTTQAVRPFKKVDISDDADKTMQLMVGQMKRGRGKVIAMIGASMACVVAVVVMFAV
ncbi:MAG: hypothetical protein ACKV2T_25045 [Kofleriaceae bacterium]